MSKTKTHKNKDSTETTSATIAERGRRNQPSVSRQTSTSTTRRTGRSKKSSSNTRLVYSIPVTSGSGTSAIRLLRATEYHDIGTLATKSIGLLNVQAVMQSNTLVGLSLSTPNGGSLYVGIVEERYRGKTAVSVGGSKSIRIANIVATG